jgi:hypothetical protein
MRNTIRRAAVAAAFAAAALAMPASHWAVGQEFDHDAPVAPKLTGIELGISVYRPELGNCQLCHGWNGQGGNMFEDYNGRTYDPGPALKDSKMTAAEMIEIISCGKLGLSIMPQYYEEAWTPKHPCWGKTAADVAETERAPLWGAPLYEEEIEAVVLWIQTAYQGKEFTLENCLLYFGTPDAIGCNYLR